MASLKPGGDDDRCAGNERDERLQARRETARPRSVTLTSGPLDLEEARHMRGWSWVGDLWELRSSRLERFSSKPGAE